MRCPRCGEAVSHGAAICGACDEVVDAALLASGDLARLAVSPLDVGKAHTRASTSNLISLFRNLAARAAAALAAFREGR